MALTNLYDRLILRQPVAVLLLITVLVAGAGWFAQYFRLDASADSLVLEDDEALRYYRSIRARYGSDDFLIVTYTPAGALFSDSVLADLSALRDQLRALQPVAGVTSILDVPLVQSPPVTLAQLRENIPTLESPGTDRALARKELLSSPLYRNLLISPDAGTTAIRVNLRRSEEYVRLLERRNELREQRLQQGLSIKQRRELAEVSRRFNRVNQAQQRQIREDIRAIRGVMDRHRDTAELHLGGVPMIVADSIRFIRHDLVVFGAGVFLFMVGILAVAFRKPRWVLLPLLTCAATAVVMTGLLGLLDWPVTVVSANFLSLLLIITLSLTIHLVVRYRELHREHPRAGQYRLVRDTVYSKAQPCFFTAVTTMVAFASLLVSDVRPVIDFGWMMCIGIAVAFVLSFTLFPCAALLFEAGRPSTRHDLVRRFTAACERVIRHHGNATLAVFAAVAMLSIAGISLLSVENRFIDYFKASTEIHQGMKLIDRKLGGTTPLDVILDAPDDYAPRANRFEGDPLAQKLLGDTAGGSGGITATSYWFNTGRLGPVGEMHASIDELSATGKVLSIDTAMRMLRELEDQDTLDNFFLSVLYRQLPDSVRQELIEPYLSQDGNQLRFAVRVFESDPDLDRDRLLADIRRLLTERPQIDSSQVHLTGMLVLYNNMLHSLFRSQIMTVGVVFVAILAMFALLFRNLRLALVAIVPNLFAAGLVMGVMGWLRIPLDLMTITIAAISIGIAVDDTIHYIHRYRTEFRRDGDYAESVRRAHASIGRALFYTTLTITLGFSILALSDFVPTIYFGLFTGLAMLTALLADLTLLPLLITRFKPLGSPRGN